MTTIDCQLFADSLRRDHANDASAMLLWRCFHFANFAQRLDHHLHDLAAFFDVGHFTTAEQHADLHFVLVLEKFLSLPDLGADVFLTRFGPQPNFLGLGVSLTRVLFLVLVVLVFAVIHDAANRRPLIGRYFDKIQARVASPFESFLGRNDSELLAFLADDPNGRNANVVVNAY